MNNGLKIFLIILGIMFLFVFFIFVLIVIFVPTEKEREIEDFYGVWEMDNTKVNPHNVNGSDIEGELPEHVDDIYMVIDNDDSFTAYEFYKDGSVNKIVYEISNFNNYIESPYEEDPSLDDAFYHVELDTNEDILISLFIDDIATSHYIVYEKSHKDLKEILDMMEVSSENKTPVETQEPAAETEQTQQPVADISQPNFPTIEAISSIDYTGYVKDITTFISDSFWMSSGSTYVNEQEQSIGEGYPITYESFRDESMYEFGANGFLYVTIFDESGFPYLTETYNWYPDENGYYIYTSPEETVIDGETRIYNTAFFIHNGLLYQTTLIDNIYVSNIIQHYEIISLYDMELQDNLYEFLKDTAWRSKAQSFDNTIAESYVAGYPKIYNFAYWELVYTFNADKTITVDVMDENQQITNTHSSTYEEYNNTYEYVYGFERTETIDGVEHKLHSEFFVVGTNLVEVEVMDDEHYVSNYIVFQQMFP